MIRVPTQDEHLSQQLAWAVNEPDGSFDTAPRRKREGLPFNPAKRFLLDRGWSDAAAERDLALFREASFRPETVTLFPVASLVEVDKLRDRYRWGRLRPSANSDSVLWHINDAAKEVAWRTTLANAHIEDLFERRYPLADHVTELGISDTFQAAEEQARKVLVQALASGVMTAKACPLSEGGGARNPQRVVPSAFWARFDRLDASTAYSRRGEAWAGVVVAYDDLDRLWPDCPGKPSGSGAATIRTTGNAKAENQCGQWLASLPPSPVRTKTDVRAEAEQRFPKLSGRGFDRAWSASAPAEWRGAGRRRKSPC